MKVSQQGFSKAWLLGTTLSLIGVCGISSAQEQPLPQPNTTIKIDGSLSSANGSAPTTVSSTAQSTTATPSHNNTLKPPVLTPAQQVIALNHPTVLAVKKPPVVELKSEFVSKEKALAIAKKKHYHFNIAYSISGGQAIKPESLAKTNRFYVNHKTHNIGVAINPNAAEFISVANHDVYSVREGDTLRATVARWAMESGYKMEWLSAYDYPLKHSYEFIGKLSDRIGPLNKILSSISSRSYALKAVITKNNVILIKDNDYSPSILGR